MDECLLCTMETADDDVVLFRDDLWAAEIVPGYDVPGWIILRVRRHAERITGLNDAELAGFAQRTRDVVAAVTEVTGAEATYLMVFGENYPHFHALITPRGEDVPPERRAGNILQLRAGHIDPRAAAALIPRLRGAYRRSTATPVVQQGT
jgi:diadenosine tetraphosphate (Ap4A) HIT family hydrolase